MKTTLNIRKDILDQIIKAAKTNNVSCSEIIFLLIKRVTVDIQNPGKLGKMVRYQGRRSPEDWHVFHVQIREDMYEYWLDLRKFLKMSVSLILANAVKKYLCKPIKINNTDNYLCKNYIIVKEVIDSIIIWKIIWGWPPNLANHFALTHGNL